MQGQFDAELDNIMGLAIQQSASDILLSVNIPPQLRIDGKLGPIHNMAAITKEQADSFVVSVLSEEQLEKFKFQKELDLSLEHQSVRFRINCYHQKGLPALAMRQIPKKIRSYEDLGLPPIIQRFAQAKQGFVIIAGPTGHGKSTTLATIVEDINQHNSGHILTIEDPIEYVFEHKNAVISQREVGNDTNSFARALKSAVREDPNVILVGEMRDFETVDAALTLAETGHLVLTTLHTNSAAQTADRIVDMFPPYLQNTARQQLSNVLLGIISQRLIPKISGGRIVASEILVATSSVRNIIREGKSHQLDNLIATSASDGMISLDKVIAEFISKGDITLDEGLNWANDAKRLKSLLY